MYAIDERGINGNVVVEDGENIVDDGDEAGGDDDADDDGDGEHECDECVGGKDQKDIMTFG